MIRLNSIRAKILAWVFFSFLLLWFGISTAVLYESRHEVEEIFDSELAQQAGILLQISTSLDLNNISLEQKLHREVYGHRYEKKIAFQIFNNGSLILRTNNAPKKILSNTDGFSDQLINGELWRVFRLNDKEQKQLILTAEQHNVREELVYDITRDSLYPLALMIPVVLMIIWLGIARGMAPIKKIAHHIDSRTPNDFSTIDVEYRIPKEINPLVVALNRMFEKLRETFERERRFTSDAAHELQTPLASVKTQTQVALRSDDAEELRNALQKINDGVNRATHLVQQLLALSRIEPGTEQPSNMTFDLTMMLQNLLADFDSEARLKNIEIFLDAQDRTKLNANPTLTEMLISNLVSNAIRYTPQDGKVTISVNKQTDKITLSVQDTGPGIPEDEKERIFERFYRGPNNQHIMGSGLGLSIVRRIALLQNVQIAINNTYPGLRIDVVYPATL